MLWVSLFGMLRNNTVVNSPIPRNVVAQPDSTTLACKILQLSILNPVMLWKDVLRIPLVASLRVLQDFEATETFGTDRDESAIWKLLDLLLVATLCHDTPLGITAHTMERGGNVWQPMRPAFHDALERRVVKSASFLADETGAGTSSSHLNPQSTQFSATKCSTRCFKVETQKNSALAAMMLPFRNSQISSVSASSRELRIWSVS